MKKYIGAFNFLLIICFLSNSAYALYAKIEPANSFLRIIWEHTKYHFIVLWDLEIMFALILLSTIYFTFNALTDKSSEKLVELDKNVKELTSSSDNLKLEKEGLVLKIAQYEEKIQELEKQKENAIPAEKYEQAKTKIYELEEAAFKAIEEMKSLNEEGSRLEAECKQQKESIIKLTTENSALIEKEADYEKIKNELKQTKEELASANANLKGGKNAIPPAAYQILYLLQKEGRLIDMLNENISEYDDETLGGAFRKLHEDLSGILKERLIIEPVINEEEGSTIVLDDIDPENIKISGNLPEKGPYKGELIHRGWRLKECKLPELVDGWKGDVIAPAEIEIQ